jgi:hypothetical protein
MPIQLQSYTTKQLEPYKLLTDLRAIVTLVNKLEVGAGKQAEQLTVMTRTVEAAVSEAGGGSGPPTPIGPFPAVIVDPNGAILGDGTAANPLRASVDGVTVVIVGNQLTAVIPSDVLTGTLTPTRIPYASAAHVLSDTDGNRWNTAGTLELTGSGQTLLAPDSGLVPMAHFGGASGVGVGTLYIDAYGNNPSFTMRRTNGTAAAPTALGASEIVFNFRSVGYDGSTSALAGLVRMIANGAWTGANHGMDFIIALTANGSTAAPSEVMRVRNNPSGTVGINFTAPGAALEVRGTPVDIGYIIKGRPTSTGSAYLQMSANGATNQAGFSYTQISNGFEWRNAVIGNDSDALRWGGGTGGTDIKMYLTQSGNLILNDSNLDPATGTKCLVFGEGTAPGNLDANSCAIYGDSDAGGTVQVMVKNEANEVTQLSGNMQLGSGLLLKFGGVTSSEVALKRSSAVLQTRLADDSAFAQHSALEFMNNRANFLMRTAVAWNNGAGAGAGTLTNAPAAGNPTKWIPVDDNGTTRHIPAW